MNRAEMLDRLDKEKIGILLLSEGATGLGAAVDALQGI